MIRPHGLFVHRLEEILCVFDCMFLLNSTHVKDLGALLSPVTLQHIFSRSSEIWCFLGLVERHNARRQTLDRRNHCCIVFRRKKTLVTMIPTCRCSLRHLLPVFFVIGKEASLIHKNRDNKRSHFVVGSQVEILP